ncbi:hypothetical protein QR680_014915 [Steinernema hermaphroditum]|uniref:Uncharacterized protein n=1 Tax=Steinernema hermaphroditum TaxID=289476 RepID=A0AA39IC39_9BILA|nr:hypothetical protein QR680_014915 [Steinernema hermaphroditum]
MADAEDDPEINLMREREPTTVHNLKRWILTVGSTTQLLFLLFGLYHIFLRVYGVSIGKKCYAFESFDQCDQPPFSEGAEFMACSVDFGVFIYPPFLYLIGLFLTLSYYRNPRQGLISWLAPYELMYPTLLPTMYYYMATICWHFSAVEQATTMYAPRVVWPRVAWTSVVFVVTGFILITVYISIRLCEYLHRETLTYLRVVREVRAD